MTDPNIRAVCDQHAPTPQGFDDVPIEDLIGKFVKLGFPIAQEIIDQGGPTLEHMWVKVEGPNEEGGEEVRGTLNNHPQFAAYELGDTVLFDRNEIEDIFTEGQA